MANPERILSSIGFEHENDDEISWQLANKRFGSPRISGTAKVK